MAGRARRLRPRGAPRRRAQRRRAAGQPNLSGIQQGVGQSVAKAFGALSLANRPRRRRARRGRMAGYNCCHHDAFHMAHLPLPRPVGPYTVIRTTKIISSNLHIMLFGPTYDPDSRWTNICAFGFNDETKTPGDNNNIYQYVFSQLAGSGFNAAQITPAAFSVQLMNPNAIQSTAGIVYQGRARTEIKLGESLTRNGTTLANELVSYNNPRLLSAAKLAFRGTQCDNVPFNMARLAEFTAIKEEPEGSVTFQASGSGLSGLAPTFIYNPQEITLQFLVCCEWRVRFDPSNPAQASHVQHQAAPESVWQKALNAAEAVGNGVIDIADKVAETGNAVFGAMGSAYRVGRGMRALAGPAQLALA